ncbi:MAG: efflux RND transporter periplasmic adaptor subunit [Gemmatimonadota bacterium]
MEERIGRRRDGGMNGAWRFPVVLVAAGLAACGGGEGVTVEAPPGANVDAVSARRDTIRVQVRSVGSLEADQHVGVAAEASGRVTSIDVDEGQTVARGRVLLRLEETKLAAEVEAARAGRERARQEAENLARQVERNRSLLAAGAISPQAFDDMQTAAETARAREQEAAAQLALARARLEEATVRAPFAGTVGAREIDVGDYVSAGDSLFILVDDDPLEIEFRVPERYAARLAIGSPVLLDVSSHPDRTFEGEVTFVSPTVDLSNRTVQLKARVPNPGGALRAGQFADVILGLEVRPDAIVVPEAAVVPRGGQTLVFVATAGHAERREVTLGERGDGRVEVLSGVQPGDTVIVAGQQRLGDGSAIALRMLGRELETAPADGASDSAGEG